MPMTKSKHGSARAESRDSKAERIYAAAMEIVEIDARDMRAKIERLRTLRLAREGGAKSSEEKPAAGATGRRARSMPVSKLNDV
jgi:hypothetical protein